jgi:hypothetical protein
VGEGRERGRFSSILSLFVLSSPSNSPCRSTVTAVIMLVRFCLRSYLLCLRTKRAESAGGGERGRADKVRHQRDQRGVALAKGIQVNWDSQSTNERGSSAVGSLGLSPVSRDFYPALAALVSLVKQKFPYRTLFQSMCLHRLAQQPGQAVVQGRLSLNVCLRTGHH